MNGKVSTRKASKQELKQAFKALPQAIEKHAAGAVPLTGSNRHDRL